MVAELITVPGAPTAGHRVQEVAAEVARLLALEVHTLPAETTGRELLDELARAGVWACVLEAGGAADGSRSWEVAAGAVKPVVLVPEGAGLHRPHVKRALVPLDGSEEVAAAVRQTADLLEHAGVELVVLHVFEPTTVPAFWDQRAHAEHAWAREFVARNPAAASARLQLSRGLPAARVLEAAEAEDVDLIALAWSRTMDPGHARTVRESVTSAAVPVLLLPIA